MQNAPRFRFSLLSPELATLTLTHDPIGWEELGVTLHRDPQLHGLTTEYTASFEFIKEGREYLEQAYQLGGIEADVMVVVEYFNPNDFLWWDYYRGQVDFTSRELTPEAFRCRLDNEGFTQRFLNRDDTPIDLLKTASVGGAVLPALVPASVLLHSRAVVKQFAATVPASPPPGGQNVVNDDESRTQVLYFGFGGSAQVNEFDVPLVFGGPVTAPGGNPAPQLPFYTTKEGGSFDFDTQLRTELIVERNGNGQGDFDKVDVEYCFRINDEAPTVLLSRSASNIGGTYRVDLDTGRFQVSRELAIGDRIYLYGNLHVYDINGNVFGNYSFPVKLNEKAGSYFKMQAQTQTEPTPCRGLLVYEALNRLAQSMTDRSTAFRSAYYGRTDTQPAYSQDGPGSLTFTAGGFQVRGFPLTGFDPELVVVNGTPVPATTKPLTTTWRELFGSLQARDAVGCGVERLPDGKEVVRVEPLGYFYQDAVTLVLAEPVALVDKTAADRFFLNVAVGYQKWETQQVNGLNEVNTKRTYTTPLTQVDSTYSQLSSAIGSGQHLELTRRQRYDATATTDGGADTDQYFVRLVRTGSGLETERNQLFADVTGLLSPETAYNLRDTPARILRRHGPVLAAGLQPQRGRALRFAAGEGNTAVTTRLASEAVAVVEGADVPVADLGEPLWAPGVYSFTAPVSFAEAVAVLQAPRGRIRFTDQDGRRREGWLIDFKHHAAGADGPTAEFTLLPCAQLLPTP